MGLPRNSSTGASFYRNVSSEKESNCTFNWSPWPTFWLSAPILSSPPHTVSPSTSPASFSLPPAWSLNTYTLGQKLKTFITTKIGPLVTKHKVKMAGCWPKSRQIEMREKNKNLLYCQENFMLEIKVGNTEWRGIQHHQPETIKAAQFRKYSPSFLLSMCTMKKSNFT